MTAVMAMLKDGKLTVREIANQIGISEATIYKNIPSPRASVAP
jgi:DNA-binding CsgD family transcriptional regulator